MSGAYGDVTPGHAPPVLTHDPLPRRCPRGSMEERSDDMRSGEQGGRMKKVREKSTKKRRNEDEKDEERDRDEVGHTADPPNGSGLLAVSMLTGGAAKHAADSQKKSLVKS